MEDYTSTVVMLTTMTTKLNLHVRTVVLFTPASPLVFCLSCDGPATTCCGCTDNKLSLYTDTSKYIYDISRLTKYLSDSGKLQWNDEETLHHISIVLPTPMPQHELCCHYCCYILTKQASVKCKTFILAQ